jgi:hypothetical protein
MCPLNWAHTRVRPYRKYCQKQLKYNTKFLYFFSLVLFSHAGTFASGIASPLGI